MRNLSKRTIVIILTLLGLNNLNLKAQNNSLQILETEYNNSGLLFSITPHPSWSKTPIQNLPDLLAEPYGITKKFTFDVISEEVEERFTFTKVVQKFGKYPVTGGDMILKRNKSGQLEAIIGTLREPAIISEPTLTEADALNIAHKTLNISDSNYFIDGVIPVKPTIKLKYANIGGIQTNKVVLCYELMISTQAPEVWYFYVNATTGNVEYYYNGLSTSNGTGATLYSGTKNINTKYTPGGYQLVDTVREIYTLNYRNLVNTNVLSPNGGKLVSDPDNNFDSTEQKYAVDAHWGMGVTYDYYLNVHGRKSYDNKGGKIQVNVRWDKDYDNAFFHPATNQMYFGKGSGTDWGDWGALDCVGHEFSHSLVNASANLVYQGESGALNESFADIFGHCIEVSQKSMGWELLEEIKTPATPGPPERDMSDPSKGSLVDPDTYNGDNWKSTTGWDNGGVHSNSGVQNYWFYLLTVGGSGTNDAPLNHAFKVTGIGQQKSEKIAYRALTKYLVSSSDYKAARKAALFAAQDLYGKNSNEYQQVCNAWYAVGVGEKCCTGNDSLTLSFKVKDTKCHNSKDGEIELTVKNKLGTTLTKCEYEWFKTDTNGTVIATSKDVNNLDSGKYVVIVKDTVNHCEAVDKTKVNAPEKLKLTISGGGTYSAPCNRSFTVTLTASASGGTPNSGGAPYNYSWPNGIKEVVCSGPNGFSTRFPASVTDKNGCKAESGAIVTYVPIVCSYDPNEIVGPPSFGDKKWVSVKATLPYKIRYENDPKFATGPAQTVTINHKLDTNTDISSFRLGSFGFYKYDFTVPNNTSTYSKRLDLRDSFGIYLDVTAGVDVSNRNAFWIFESIDPKTGLPPTAGGSGFLAVNDTITHKGEGYVNYTIKPKSKAKTGDSIRAKAVIVFDANPEVLTPRIHNLIDAVAPTTSIKSMASVIDSSSFRIYLNGKDDNGGSGFASYDIYVSENGGVYKLNTKGVSDSFFVFSGNFGSVYKAYSIGADNTDNKEVKSKAEVTFTIASKDFFKPFTPNTSLCSGDTLKIRWFKSFFNSINLQYSADSGKTYTTFATGLGGSDTLYKWAIPGSITGKKRYFLRSISASNNAIIDSSEYFELKQGPVFNIGKDTSFCDKSSFSLTLNPGSGFTSYKWSDSTTNSTLTVNNYGTYWVKVVASTGCSATDQITVSKDLLPVVSSITVNNPLCFGSNTGSIDITVVSGHAPYKYKWSNNDTTQDISNLLANKYVVNITDSKLCKIKDSATVTQPTKLSKSHVISNVKCFGGSDGSVNVTITGGTTPYTYSWSNASTSQNLTGLSAGTYILTVTDKNNCTIKDTVVITQPTKLAKSHSITDVKCNAGTDGAIDLTVSGGTTPYTYLWSNSATSQDLTGISAGTYTVLVTDKNNCTIRDTAIVAQPAKLSKSHSLTMVKCNAGNDGAVALTISGGTTPYSYLWSNSSTSQNLSGLTAGTYTVLVTDKNGCTIRDTAVITQPTKLAKSHSITNVKCFGNNDGAVALTISGGTTPYSYSWSNSATTQNLSSLVAGTYTVTVTDKNACTIKDTAIVTQPTKLAKSKSITNVKCNAGNDGAVNLTITGGVTPYGYVWSNAATTANISGLTAGTYTVTVTDNNGCVIRDTAVITQPNKLTKAKVVTNVNCFGNNNGSVDLTIAGGTTPYAYSWSNSSTSEDLTSLAPGTYTVVVTDKNGCIIRDTATITQPNKLAKSKTITQVKCFGNTDGAVALTITGGTTPYSYSWINSSTNQNLSNVGAGTYTVLVTDKNGCTIRDTATITQPTKLAKSKTITNVTCNGGNNGAVSITISGGVTPYSYLWSNASTSQNLTGLTAGTYIVTVTDNNGCTIKDTAVVTQPNALTKSKAITNVKCNGGNDGAVTLTIGGGTTPYTYAWSNSSTSPNLTALVAGTYTVLVTDKNGCTIRDTAIITQPNKLTKAKTITAVKCNGGNDGAVNITIAGGTTPYTYLWSNSSTNEDQTGLTAGTYTVLVTDKNGCTIRDTAVITQPNKLTKSKSVTNVKCFGGNDGAVSLTIAGGVTPYTYSWSNSATGATITSLTAGTYYVTVTDNNGCTIKDTATITQPNKLTKSKSITNVKCFGGNDGAVNLTIAGGVTPYSYSWSNSSTNPNLSSIIAGTYYVTVTDNNGCTIKDTAIVTQPTKLTKSHTFADVKCFGGNDGSINLTISGGVTAYTYAWSNGSSSQNLSGLTSGTYYVTVTDANACIIKDTVVINQPTKLVASNVLTHVKCFGGNDGALNLTVTGGVTPYNFSWSNGAKTEDLSGLKIGKYVVTVTDKNNCTVKDSGQITEPPLLTVSHTITDVKCFSGNDGAMDITVNGGVTPYVYSWNSGDITQDITNKTTGTYKVTITDKNLCVLKDSGFISQPAAPLTSTLALVPVNCFGGNDGSADLSVSGGTSPYTYSWSNGKSSQDLTGLNKGIYYVTITDANNCKLLDTADITQPALPLQSTHKATNIKCFGDATGSVDLTVTGGTTPYTFAWSNSSTNEDLTSVVSGSYLVIITDKNLCTFRDSVTLTQPVAPLSSSIAMTAVKCFGGNDGALNLSVAGGTAPYTFKWSNASTFEDINTLIQGKYKVVVTDDNGCTLNDSAIVTQPAAPLISTNIVTDAKCFGSSDGTINLTPTGGTAPYTFNWSNGKTSEDVTGLKAGKYFVTITDINLCTFRDSATINEPTKLVTTTDGTSATPNSENGIVWVAATGGTPPYTYAWTPKAGTRDTLENVKIGTYFVVVTDANGCTTKDTAIVPEAPKTAAIKIFPNPSNGFITVTNLEAFGLDLTIHFELYDLVGKKQMSFETIGQDVHTFKLDDNLYNNAYILRIYNSRYEENRKVFLLR